MSKIVLIIGLPASGKSFIAERLSQGSHFQRWVSTDRIRQRLFGDESIQGPWLSIWAQVRGELQQTTLLIWLMLFMMQLMFNAVAAEI
ncbi:AAA family ATPase [Arthrospira platensis BEA 1257B]